MVVMKLNEHNSGKKVIAVVSGKGGVGKSIVYRIISYAANKLDKVGVMDADI